MRRARPLSSIVAAAAFALGTGTLAGCANQQQRRWDTCAEVGAFAGGILGGMSGFAIADKTQGGHSGVDDSRDIASGLGGFVVGGVIGAIAGHYICDPVEQTPPPMSQ